MNAGLFLAGAAFLFLLLTANEVRKIRRLDKERDRLKQDEWS